MSADIRPFTVLRGGRPDRWPSARWSGVQRARPETPGRKLKRLRRRDPFAASVVETMIDNLLARLDRKNAGA